MCFRPASTTMGARICKSCYNVIDDIEADICPYCGNPLEASFVKQEKPSEPAAPQINTSAPPKAMPKAPPQTMPKAPAPPRTPQGDEVKS